MSRQVRSSVRTLMEPATSLFIAPVAPSSWKLTCAPSIRRSGGCKSSRIRVTGQPASSESRCLRWVRPSTVRIRVRI